MNLVERFAPILRHICCAIPPTAPIPVNPYHTCPLRHGEEAVASVPVDQDGKVVPGKVDQKLVHVAVPAVVVDRQTVAAATACTAVAEEAETAPIEHHRAAAVWADPQKDGKSHAMHCQRVAAEEVVLQAPAGAEQGLEEEGAQTDQKDSLLRQHWYQGDPVGVAVAVADHQKDFPLAAKHKDSTAAVQAPKLSIVPDAAAVPRTEHSFAEAAAVVEAEANSCRKDYCPARAV